MTTTSQRPLSLLDFVDIPAGARARGGGTHGPHRPGGRPARLQPLLDLRAPQLRRTGQQLPEILIAHIAAATEGIRVGAAGIMLPNHSPLKVAEWFKTLEMLHPGRIDLGLGRAPGTDQLTAFALRRSREALTADDFPQQAAELIAFLTDTARGAPVRGRAGHAGRADAARAAHARLQRLGATFAAANGMTTVFAHHMSPEIAVAALRVPHELRPVRAGRQAAGHHLGAGPGERGPRDG